MWFCIFLENLKILIRSRKSKMIYFKIEKYEASIKFFLKCNLSIIDLFESYLLKNNRHNYKQPNTIRITDMYSANR